MVLCLVLTLCSLAAVAPPASALHWCGPLGIGWSYRGVAYVDETLDFSISLTNGLPETLEVTAITVILGWETRTRDWGPMTIPGQGAGTNTHPITLPPAPRDYSVGITVTGRTPEEDLEVCKQPDGPFTKKLTVAALPPPPQVLVKAFPSLGPAPLAVTFVANVIEGLRPFAYAWDFGDGNSSTDVSPSHRYLLPGEYTVRVVVRDRGARVTWDNTTVAVQGGSDKGPPIGTDPRGFFGELGPLLWLGIWATAASLCGLFFLLRRRRTPPGPPLG